MIDRKNVIDNLEQNIRWIEEIECHQFPGWGNVTMAMRDTVELLKEQEQEKNVYTWICPKCESRIILKAYKANEAIGMSFDCCPVCGKDVLYGKAD